MMYGACMYNNLYCIFHTISKLNRTWSLQLLVKFPWLIRPGDASTFTPQQNVLLFYKYDCFHFNRFTLIESYKIHTSP